MRKFITAAFVLAFSVAANAQSNQTDTFLPNAAFVVNHNGDTNDLSAGDGVCADASGKCTLRAAIQEANALFGDDMVSFALPTLTTISLTLGRILISDNTSIVGTGARNLIVQRSIAAGTPSFRIFSIAKLNTQVANITVNISGVTIANGEDVGISGGGIINGSNCILNLTEVAVRNNRAVDAPGGGITNFGLLTVNRSTISNNSASQGGGISNQPDGTVRLNNTTFSSNAALGVPANNISGAGGAINNFNQATLNNVTISSNTSTNFAAGISTTSLISLRNTIVAGNVSPSNPDVSGSFFNSLGNNLIGNNIGAATSFPAGNPNANGDKVGTPGAPLNALLGALQNNGGQTDTLALLSGSPAIDFGNNCVVDNSCSSNNPSAALTTDQRGEVFFRRVGTNVDSGAFETGNLILSNRRAFDFDGDGKSDVSVFRPANGVWYIQQSANGFTGISFGFSNDKIIPADYDGDGKTDVAVFRGGTWYLQRSQLGFTGVAFGDANDIPVPADYDGDGKADVAVFRPSNGTWYLLQSQLGFVGVTFGQNGDKPVAADYDGDGKADVAVYRGGIWYLQRSSLGFVGINFGDANDKSVPADYDGDGKADVAVFRPSNGVWYLQQSTAGFAGIAFGLETDLPVAADYDGDGKTDVAVFRNGTWYLNRTTQGFTGITFGASTDRPAPNAFIY